MHMPILNCEWLVIFNNIIFNLSSFEFLVVCIGQTLQLVQSNNTFPFVLNQMKMIMITAIVVDDDFDTVEVFSEFLNLKNVEVLGRAYNGFDGVKLYDETRPDIVFSDIWMPEYDGFYLLKNLKESYANSTVVMVTADLTHETDKKLKELNADAVIFKPFKMKKVTELIDQIYQKKILVHSSFK